ncbi:MAG: hypothetical protein KA521_11790 [Crocinitomicaceae bacterium]|nr:hypothetical protein [Crocinitomicaceae bacterium]
MNTKNSNRLLLLMMMVLPLLGACKKENLVDNQGIYPVLTVSYDAKKDQTTVNAYLKQGGNFGVNLIPDKNAPVVVNNEPMYEKTTHWIAGPYFEKVLDGYQSNISFSWKDETGVVRQETISGSTIQFKTAQSAIQVGSNAFLEWDGQPVMPNETVSLISTFGSWKQLQVGEKSIQLTADGLHVQSANFPITKFTLERKLIKSISGSKGQSGQIIYAYSDIKNMDINPVN